MDLYFLIASTVHVDSGKVSGLAQMLDDEVDDAQDAAAVESSTTIAEKQMASFTTLLETQTRLKFDNDPLLWWSTHQSLLPELSLLARSYLGIQPTSCASERLFSMAGFVVKQI